MNIDTLLFGEIVQDQQGNVRRDFGLCNMVVWGLIIALIYTYSGGNGGKGQKGGASLGWWFSSDGPLLQWGPLGIVIVLGFVIQFGFRDKIKEEDRGKAVIALVIALILSFMWAGVRRSVRS